VFAGDNKNTPASLANSEDPNVLFKRKFYKEAIDKFMPIFEKDKENIDVAYKIGLCYLLGSIDYMKAVPFLKKAAESEKGDNDAYYMLGKAFHNALMFDNAITAYTKSLETLKDKTGDDVNEIKRNSQKAIDNCKFARLIIDNPVDVSFENLGKDVNSQFADLDPCITPNKTEMVFSSNRAEGNQCEKPRKLGYTFDAYMSIYKGGKWTKAINMGPSVNTPLNERVSSISSDASNMFLYIDNEESTKDGDIYVAISNGKAFSTPINLKGLINTGSEESNASISQDGSMLYFASDRPGGSGAKDIYVAKRLPTGDWAAPKRLSNVINTIYNEDYPVIMPDDKTLYFASQGHDNIGGYDIFKCEWVDTLNNWSEPENLGYPVNTPEDNFSISITEKLHEGYISAIRPEGMGDYDLYKIIFNQASSAPYSIIRGKISNTDIDGINTDVAITVINKKTQKLVSKFNISAKRKGSFFGIFYPGEYTFEITNAQSKPYKTDIIVIDKNIRGDLLKKDFAIPSIIEPIVAPVEPPKKVVKKIKGKK